MSFLNPWLLAGAAAIAAPIIIHLMMRQQTRRIKWAAMRFLQPVLQRNERSLRIEDLLLLLLRCLLLLLLALTLSRPAFRAAGVIPPAGSRTIVLAVDNSLGMGLTDGGSSRLDNARRAAAQIIDALPPGSSAALLAYSDVARPIIAEPATDLNLVKKLIVQIPLTDRSSNVHPVLRQSLDILKRHAAGAGDIYLITGAQATGWRELASIRTEISASHAHLGIIIPGPGQEPNLGISAITLGSAMVPAGAAVRFGIQVANYGPDPVHNVTVSLGIDGEPPNDQAVITAIPAGESRRLSLFTKAATAGYHTVTAQLPPDHLAADDRRSLVVHAVDEVRVLLVAGDMGATPRQGDAFFLERALTPVAPEDRSRYFIKTETVPAGQLFGVKLADFDAVALVDVPSLAPGLVAGLEKFVRDGGGLMIFPGDQTDPAFYNTLLGEGLGLLPATIGSAWGDASQAANFRTLQPAGYTHPMVSVWQDPASGTLATAHFFKGFTLKPLRKLNDRAGESVTVLAYSGGAPAVVERAWGNGRVIQFSSSANTAWNDLPAHPAFVPLMQRALGRLVTARDDALAIPVGAEFTYPARPDWLYKEMTVTKPGPPSLPDKSKVELVNGQPLLRYADTDYAGPYGVAIATDPATSLRFAAQPDPDESKLEPIPDSELKSLAPGTQVIHWTPGSGTGLAVASEGAGRELWSLFALLALAVACFETYLAGRYSASK